MSRLPNGAQEIWDMRVQRKKPNEVVFVSMCGPLNAGNFQVLITGRDRIEQLDLRWAVDLSLCLVYNRRVPVNRVSEMSRALVRQAPNGGYVTPFDRTRGYLWTWDADKQNGFLLSWWKGYIGVPEWDVPNQPEELTVSPMYPLDRHTFMGVKPE